METIHKYILNDDINYLNLPKEYLPLSIITQRNKVVLYCIVNPDNEPVKARFDVIGTGWETGDGFFDDKMFVGTTTTLEGTYVWHVFEVFE